MADDNELSEEDEEQTEEVLRGFMTALERMKRRSR